MFLNLFISTTCDGRLYLILIVDLIVSYDICFYCDELATIANIFEIINKQRFIYLSGERTEGRTELPKEYTENLG